MKGTREKRFYPVECGAVRIEKRGDGEPLILHGMAPPYDSWSPFRWDMKERFLPDAFSESTEDVIGTVEHDNSKIFGRVSADTLTLEDRDDGAYYSATLGTRSYELDLVQSVERREIKGSSFEFFTVEDEWEKEEITGGILWKRTVKKAVRIQVGPVARPFYPDSTAALRSLERQEGYVPEPPSFDPKAYYARRQQLLQRKIDSAGGLRLG